MGKVKKILGAIIILVFGIIVIAWTSGPSVNTEPPARIEEFLIIDQGNYWEVQLILSDKEGKYTASPGTLKLEIKDEYGFSVYSTALPLKQEDFIWFKRVSGQERLGYVGKIYKDTLSRKGFSDFGTAYVEFITTDGKILTAQDDLIGIPKMSDKEKEEYFEQQYLQNSWECANCVVTKGNFKIEITRYGWYTYADWEGLKRYFRIDFKVTNIGKEPDYIFTENAYLIDLSDNKQYSPSWNSKLKNSEIFPGVTEDGYLLFEDLSEEPSRDIKLIWVISDWQNIYCEFYLHI